MAFGGGQPVNMFIRAYPEPEVNRFIDSILPSEADVEADEALAEEVAGDLASAEAGTVTPSRRIRTTEAAVGLARSWWAADRPRRRRRSSSPCSPIAMRNA